jgi:hypothetical protein
MSFAVTPKGGLSYPTPFLVYLTDDVELEIALCRAYNRFMSGA